MIVNEIEAKNYYSISFVIYPSLHIFQYKVKNNLSSVSFHLSISVNGRIFLENSEGREYFNLIRRISILFFWEENNL